MSPPSVSIPLTVAASMQAPIRADAYRMCPESRSASLTFARAPMHHSLATQLTKLLHALLPVPQSVRARAPSSSAPEVDEEVGPEDEQSGDSGSGVQVLPLSLHERDELAAAIAGSGFTEPEEAEAAIAQVMRRHVHERAHRLLALACAKRNIVMHVLMTGVTHYHYECMLQVPPSTGTTHVARGTAASIAHSTAANFSSVFHHTANPGASDRDLLLLPPLASTSVALACSAARVRCQLLHALNQFSIQQLHHSSGEQLIITDAHSLSSNALSGGSSPITALTAQRELSSLLASVWVELLYSTTGLGSRLGAAHEAAARRTRITALWSRWNRLASDAVRLICRKARAHYQASTSAAEAQAHAPAPPPPPPPAPAANVKALHASASSSSTTSVLTSPTATKSASSFGPALTVPTGASRMPSAPSPSSTSTTDGGPLSPASQSQPPLTPTPHTAAGLKQWQTNREFARGKDQAVLPVLEAPPQPQSSVPAAADSESTASTSSTTPVKPMQLSASARAFALLPFFEDSGSAHRSHFQHRPAEPIWAQGLPVPFRLSTLCAEAVYEWWANVQVVCSMTEALCALGITHNPVFSPLPSQSDEPEELEADPISAVGTVSAGPAQGIMLEAHPSSRAVGALMRPFDPNVLVGEPQYSEQSLDVCATGSSALHVAVQQLLFRLSHARPQSLLGAKYVQ
jgi:hypothetical protein